MNTIDARQAYDEYKRLAKQRRKQIVQRKVFLILLTIVMIIGMSVSYRAIISKASSNTDGVEYKYFTSIMVEYGDNLWTIAEKYSGEQYASTNTYIEEVIKINALREDNVMAGQYLIVPYYSGEYIQ